MQRSHASLLLVALLAREATSQTPSPSSMSPASGPPGTLVTISGSGLTPAGFTARVFYQKKYVASGESRTASVPATIVSASSVTFQAPSNAQVNQFFLEYTPIDPRRTQGFRSPFAIPGAYHVVEPPTLTGTSANYHTGTGVTRLLGSTRRESLKGTNLVPPPGSTVTVTIGTTTIALQGSAVFSASMNGGLGGDSLILAPTEPGTIVSGALTVTTAGGSATLGTNPWVLARRPRPTRVDSVTSNGQSTGIAVTRLIRGGQYEVRGTDLHIVHTGSGLTVQSNLDLRSPGGLGASVGNQQQGALDPARHRFTVPTTFTPTQATLLVRTAARDSAVFGSFAVTDPGALPPPLQAFVISPSPSVAGSALAGTVSFAGSIPAGQSVGDLVFTGSFAGSPRTVPITTNPMTVSLQTFVTASAGMDYPVKVRLSRFTGATDSLQATYRVTTPRILSFQPMTSSVPGGSEVTFNAQFDFPTLTGATCPTLPGMSIDPWIEVTSSDTALYKVRRRFDHAPVASARHCISGSPTSIVIVTQPQTTARQATVTATGSFGTASGTITIQPPTLASITSNRSTLTSLQSATGTLQLSAPMSGAFALLATSDPAVSVPSKVTFGTTTTATFNVGTLPVPTARSVTLSAVVGSDTRTLTLQLQPLAFADFSLSPSALKGGTNSVATVRLNATINVPFTATLSSSDPAATVPATLAFAAGQDAAVFNVQTATVSATKTVTLTVTYTVTPPGASPVTMTRTATLTVNP